MKKTINLLILSAICIYLNACNYKNKEDLNPGLCDTTNVTYSKNIAPIISSNCLSCHTTSNPSGGINLNGYSQLVGYATSGLLECVVKNSSNCVAMPPSGKLTDCEINKISAWIKKGAPNN